MAFTLKINGTPHEVDVDGDTPLWVLRDALGMTATKFGCVRRGVSNHEAAPDVLAAVATRAAPSFETPRTKDLFCL